MPAFDQCVFVNCPFDPNYRPLFRPLVFTINYLGLKARTSYEAADSGEPRIQKLVRLIESSKFGIHDLSRCQADDAGEYFRLNMPLELGIDYGCRYFGGGKWRQKKFLILETQRFRYQKTISDLAGSDIKAHKDDPDEIMRVTRDWLVQEARAKPRSFSEIKAKFDDFMGENFARLTADGYSKNDIKRIPPGELFRAMGTWIPRNRP